MKKFLLTFVLSIIGFIGFSSAHTLTLTCPGSFDTLPCSPSPAFTLSSPTTGVCFSVDNSYFGLGYKLFGENSYMHSLNTTSEICLDDDRVSSFILYNGGFGNDGNNFEVVLNYSLPGEILKDGTSTFTPVISSVFNVIGQFIPYVVYIGIGILIVTVGFYAIKWLVNWIVNKINNYFK